MGLNTDCNKIVKDQFNPGNMFKVKKIIKIQKLLKETGKLERFTKSKEFSPEFIQSN